MSGVVAEQVPLETRVDEFFDKAAAIAEAFGVKTEEHTSTLPGKYVIHFDYEGDDFSFSFSSGAYLSSRPPAVQFPWGGNNLATIELPTRCLFRDSISVMSIKREGEELVARGFNALVCERPRTTNPIIYFSDQELEKFEALYLRAI